MPQAKNKQPDLISWLVKSGMQCQTAPDRGGIFGWMDERTNHGSYLYTESTGYLLTLMSNRSALDRHPLRQNILTSAADWIVSVALTECGSVLTRKYPYCGHNNDPFDFSRGIAVLFDSCIAGYGLVNAYRETKNEGYAEAALRIGWRCRRSFFDDELFIRNVLFDTVSGKVVWSAPGWSRQCGSFNVKTAMFFAELEGLSGDAKYSRVVEGLIQNALSRQAEDGRFVTCDSTRNTHLHPHCYTVEGLLFMSQWLSRADIFERAVHGIDFIFRNCLDPNLRLSQSWPNADHYCGAQLRSDVVAQVLRLYYVVKLIDPTFSFAWEDRLPALHQLMDSFVLANGGTSYGFDADGVLIHHSNSWCQFFRVEMELFRYCYDQQLGFPAGEIVIT